MKKWLYPLLIVCLLIPGLCSAAGNFVLLSSTIGPIDSGIVGLLEDEFEKDTGIRVRHVGAGTFVGWLVLPEKGQKIISTFGKDKFGSPLFFPNSKEWTAAKNK